MKKVSANKHAANERGFNRLSRNCMCHYTWAPRSGRLRIAGINVSKRTEVTSCLERREKTILGLSTAAYTLLRVLISLVGIGSGLIVMYGFLTGKRLESVQFRQKPHFKERFYGHDHYERRH